MSIENPVIRKVFDDLDKFLDYCRFEGKVFNEADLYKSDAPMWQAYQKYQNYLRAKARNGDRPFTPRPRKPRFENNRGN
jgi:hypothetical protein